MTPEDELHDEILEAGPREPETVDESDEGRGDAPNQGEDILLGGDEATSEDETPPSPGEDVDPADGEPLDESMDEEEAPEDGDSTGDDAPVEDPDDPALLSDEELFPDCGCGLDESCVTESDNEAEGEGDVSAEGEDDDEESEGSPDPEEEAPLIPNIPRDEEEEIEAGPDDAEEDMTCFVATAAFRDYAHPDVAYLREFRDTSLSRHSAGRAFIDLYWRIGPILAKPVAKNATLAATSRILIKGIVLLIKALRRN